MELAGDQITLRLDEHTSKVEERLEELKRSVEETKKEVSTWTGLLQDATGRVERAEEALGQARDSVLAARDIQETGAPPSSFPPLTLDGAYAPGGRPSRPPPASSPCRQRRHTHPQWGTTHRGDPAGEGPARTGRPQGHWTTPPGPWEDRSSEDSETRRCRFHHIQRRHPTARRHDTCANCAGAHPASQYTDTEFNAPRCANCKEDGHAAWDRNCPTLRVDTTGQAMHCTQPLQGKLQAPY